MKESENKRGDAKDAEKRGETKSFSSLRSLRLCVSPGLASNRIGQDSPSTVTYSYRVLRRMCWADPTLSELIDLLQRLAQRQPRNQPPTNQGTSLSDSMVARTSRHWTDCGGALERHNFK